MLTKYLTNGTAPLTVHTANLHWQ